MDVSGTMRNCPESPQLHHCSTCTHTCRTPMRIPEQINPDTSISLAYHVFKYDELHSLLIQVSRLAGM